MNEELKAAISEALKGLEGKFQTTEQVKSAIEKSLEGKFDNLASKEDITKAIEDFSKEATKDFKAMIEKIEVPETKNKTLQEEITEKIMSLDPSIQDVASLKSFLKKNGTKDITLKAITPIASTANTDLFVRTAVDPNVAFPALRKLAFLPYFKVVMEESDKDSFGYTEGTYTSNAGYVGEGVGPANSDSATAAASTRVYAKVSAVQQVNTETFEGIPDLANALVAKLQEGIMLYVDGQALNGDGLAPGGIKHIHGLLSDATAFNTVTYTDTVKKANTADLIAAVKTQISSNEGNYMADKVWMNPLDLFKLERTKDTSGQPVVNLDFFGKPTIAGLEIIPTSAITANTMLVADTNVIEWRTKRTMQLKMGQILDGDVLNDRQSAIMFARYQTLVRNLDKVGLVKVTSISAALAALDPDVA